MNNLKKNNFLVFTFYNSPLDEMLLLVEDEEDEDPLPLESAGVIGNLLDSMTIGMIGTPGIDIE